MKKKKKYLIFLLGILMCLGAGHVSAGSNLESDLDNAKEEQAALKSERKDAKKTLSGLESKKENLEEYIKGIDNDLNAREKTLNNLSNQLTQTETNLEKTRAELAAAEEKEKIQYAGMKERIRYIYEQGQTSYLESLLGAESFADFLNRAEYVKEVYEYDKNIFLSYQETKNSIAQAKAKLEEELKTIEQTKADVEYEKEQLQILSDAKEAQMKDYETNIKDMEQLIKEYDEDIKAQDSVIKQIEAQIKKQKEAANAGAGNVTLTYDGGKFTHPCPGYKTISSPFGWRIHPTLKVNKFHNGVDLAANYGTPIYAAYKGTVAGAGYNSSMGNYVMIDHGGGLFTIYMHASKLLVSTGQSVSAGQNIALVGSTGRSTGNHLHFGVRLNGSYVDPMSYISK